MPARRSPEGVDVAAPTSRAPARLSREAVDGLRRLETDPILQGVRVTPTVKGGVYLLSLVLACGGESGEIGDEVSGGGDEISPGTVRRFGPRRLREAAWDTVFQLGGSPQDTVLLQPEPLTARNGRVYVFDYGDRALKAFDMAGTPVWRLGRRGEGPGEFVQPVDVEVGPEGNVWVVDPGAGRIAIVSSKGEWVGVRLLGDELTRDVLPLEDGTYILVSHAPGDRMFSIYDREGTRVGERSVPDPDIARAYWSARATMSTLSSVNHASWVAPFWMGDLFLLYDGTALRCRGDLIEGGPFPREAYRELPPVWVVAGVMDEERVYLLPKGETDLALRMVDVYDAHDCDYRESITLPGEFRTLALTDDVFVLPVRDALYPTILGLRLIDR